MNQIPPTVSDIERAIRNVPDFPKPGIQFKDITPLLADAWLFAGSIDLLTAQRTSPAPLMRWWGLTRAVSFSPPPPRCGFKPVSFLCARKASLPYKTHEEDYALEYGTNTIAIHIDAVKPGSRVLLIDDLLATGGTAAAAAQLLQKVGAQILEINFLIELGFLNGREKLKGFPIRSLVHY